MCVLNTYPVESDECVHDILVSAIHGVLMGLNIQSVKCLVLSEPSIFGKKSKLS